MADSVKITIFGDEFFRHQIRAMRHRARDMSPILNEIGSEWVDIIEEQFSTEGVRSGSKWDELKPATISRRRSAHPILVDSGDMLIEMTGPDNIDVSDDELTMRLPETVGARAEAHQFGFHNELTDTDIPARPMVDFTDFDRERFEKMLQDYLVNGDGA